MVVDRLTSIHNFSADVFEEFCEADDFVLNLVSQFSCVAENDCAGWLRIGFNVLEDRQNKYRSFTHS